MAPPGPPLLGQDGVAGPGERSGGVDRGRHGPGPHHGAQALEGGGEAVTALQGGHIQVYSGDAAEAATQIQAGTPIRVLAVFSDQRLPGQLANVPTAKEQGFDISWPIIRGFYMGPKVADADFNAWTAAFQKAMATPAFAKLREERGLFPMTLTGVELDVYVKRHTHQYAKLAAELGLVVNK